MITSWQMYWLTRLDVIHGVFCVLILVSCLSLTVCGIVWRDNLDDRYGKESGAIIKSCKTFFKNVFNLLILLIMVLVFLPRTNEMAAILIIPKIMNNQKIQQMPDRVLDLANVWLEELKPKKSQ